MALNEADVKTGIGGMMLEIWALQKRVQELQAEVVALQKMLRKDEEED